MSKIRCIHKKTDRVHYFSAHLANNASYMKKMGFKKDQIAEMPKATFGTPKEDAQKSDPIKSEHINDVVDSDIRADILSLDMDELKKKYEVARDWAPLARELGLMGNHKGTKEENLINKIKNKLSE